MNTLGLSTQDCTKGNKHTRNIGVLEIINSNLQQYIQLSKYLYANKDLNSVVSEWKMDMKKVHGKLNPKISLPKPNNLAIV